MRDETRPRPYRKRKRADREEETRRRITEAAVELHGTVGPARTKVTDIAERAGVSRMTVYNHFPTDAHLMAACSAHWAAANPLPDLSGWGEIADPSERVHVGLSELYAWYRGAESMMGNILRDAPIMAPLGEIMEGFWWPYVEEAVRVLAAGWPPTASEKGDLQAALRLMVEFCTWQVLSRAARDDEHAAELALRMVTGACGASSSHATSASSSSVSAAHSGSPS
jgi:AcrR family transcriptional regulator